MYELNTKTVRHWSVWPKNPTYAPIGHKMFESAIYALKSKNDGEML